MALYEYDAFGNIITKCGSLANSFLFSTQLSNTNAGLYMYMFRNYDPHLGRWTQRDPIGLAGGLNLYKHCLNSPVNIGDILGLVGAVPYDISSRPWLGGSGNTYGIYKKGPPKPRVTGSGLLGAGIGGGIGGAISNWMTDKPLQSGLGGNMAWGIAAGLAVGATSFGTGIVAGVVGGFAHGMIENAIDLYNSLRDAESRLFCTFKRTRGNKDEGDVNVDLDYKEYRTRDKTLSVTDSFAAEYETGRADLGPIAWLL